MDASWIVDALVWDVAAHGVAIGEGKGIDVNRGGTVLSQQCSVYTSLLVCS